MAFSTCTIAALLLTLQARSPVSPQSGADGGPPASPPGLGGATLLCLAKGFHPAGAALSWSEDGASVRGEEVQAGVAQRQPDKSYTLSSVLTLPSTRTTITTTSTIPITASTNTTTTSSSSTTTTIPTTSSTTSTTRLPPTSTTRTSTTRITITITTTNTSTIPITAATTTTIPTTPTSTEERGLINICTNVSVSHKPLVCSERQEEQILFLHYQLTQLEKIQEMVIERPTLQFVPLNPQDHDQSPSALAEILN
ncbi:hypothetical protein CRUP_018148 [Coryphaenoides rupestris]|nr:hypothetical protein CRUP_018148 [Coryphaenoides rupestris]